MKSFDRIFLMPVSHPLKTIFIHIPKTGGTSVEAVLGIEGKWPEWNEDILFGPIKIKGKPYQAQHLTMSQLQKYDILPPQVLRQYFSFCFVRNPWERAVSDYVWMIEKNLFKKRLTLCSQEYKHQWCHPSSPYLQKKRFKKFLTFLQKKLEKKKGGHFCHFWPQTWFFLDENNQEIVDFIGRYENLSTDFATVCTHLQIPPLELPVFNTTKRLAYQNYYDEESKELLAKIYQRDIEYLGYTF